MTKVALVGLGLIGRERYRALQTLAERGMPVSISGVLDPASPESEVDLAVPDLEALIATEPDWFVVATPHDVAVEMVRRLLPAGARVLVEKPLGRSLAEAEALAGMAAPGQLWVGFNYRFFVGIHALLSDVHRGLFGRPISVEALVGHGGAPGMEASWKLDPVQAGGGALIDPGVHLLDLALLLGGGKPLQVLGGSSWHGFWNTGVEEECQLLLGNEQLPTANLQISIVRWRSTFRLAFHGEDGYGIVEGRGRSYGPQTYRRGRRWGWQGASSQADSEELVAATDGNDVFARELQALLFGPADAVVGPCDTAQAVAGMRLLEACRRHLGLPTAHVSDALTTSGDRA